MPSSNLWALNNFSFEGPFLSPTQEACAAAAILALTGPDGLPRFVPHLILDLSSDDFWEASVLQAALSRQQGAVIAHIEFDAILTDTDPEPLTR